MDESAVPYNKRVRQLRRNIKSSLGTVNQGMAVSTTYSHHQFAASHTPDHIAGESTEKTNVAVKRPRKADETNPALPKPTTQTVDEPNLEEPSLTDNDNIMETETVVQFKIDALVNYQLCLKSIQDAIITINSKMIGIADYDSSKGTINITSYRVIVRIRGNLYCSCQKSQEVMLGHCAATTQRSGDPCVHIAALCNTCTAPQNNIDVDEWFDEDHTYSANSEEEVPVVYPVNDWTAMVFDPRCHKFGCVFVHAGNVRCRCTSHRGACTFLTAFRAALNSDETLEILRANLESHEEVTIRERTCVSWMPIQMAVSRVPMPSKDSRLLLHCRICTSPDLEELSANQVLCYGATASFYLKVPTGTCKNCHTVGQCDGSGVGVLHMGDYAMSHQVLRDFLKLFVSDGLPLYSFYKKLCWTYLEQGIYSQRPSYYQLRMAWISFSGLLTVDNFSCPTCLLSPPIIVCDGLTLSFRKKHRLSPSNGDSSLSRPLTGCNFSKLVLVNSAPLRKQIIATAEDPTEEGIQKLVEDAFTLAPFLLPALESFVAAKNIPMHWRYFLKDVCKHSSVRGYAQCSASILEDLWSELESQGLILDNVLLKLEAICPPLYTFTKNSTVEDRVLVKPVIEKILAVLRYVEQQPPHPLPGVEEAGVDTTGVFPDLPIIRERGNYALDGSAFRDSCRKLSRGHKTLLPGIFLIFCEHGVCYGFSVMDSHESPNMPFTILMTRFPKAPKVVVYDNCCNLHSYVLNRNPGFFQDTRFLVDRFHWNNHTACSSGYCVNGYPDLACLNTQVAEQRNATLNRLKASLSYQNQENFFRSMKVFLSFRNTLKILTIRDPLNETEKVIKDLSVLFK